MKTINTSINWQLKFAIIAFCFLHFTNASYSASICSAQFSHYSLSNPDSVHYYSTGSGAVSWHWNFGDGTSSTDQFPWHFYSHAGTFQVCLIITDSLGATCDHCDSVHVGAATHTCNAEFLHYSLSNPDSIHFYPVTTTATSYIWDFGDGTTSTNQDPWHYFHNPGSFHVCLTITDSLSVTCTWCYNIVITAFNSNTSIMIAPNPSNANAVLTLANLVASADLRIFNMAGQVVYERTNLSDGTYYINTEQMHGFYNFTISNGSNYLSRGKLIVMH